MCDEQNPQFPPPQSLSGSQVTCTASLGSVFPRQFRLSSHSQAFSPPMFSLNFLVPHAMICITIVTFPILVPFLDWVLAGGKLGPWLLFWGLVPLSSPALLPFPTHQALLFPNRECLCRAVWPGLWPGSRYSQTERDCMELMRPPARVSAVGQNTMPHKNNIAPSTLPALRFGLISVFSIASPDGAGPLTRGAGFSHSAIVLWIPPTTSPFTFHLHCHCQMPPS